MIAVDKRGDGFPLLLLRRGCPAGTGVVKKTMEIYTNCGQ
jgi:hypothetical protein